METLMEMWRQFKIALLGSDEEYIAGNQAIINHRIRKLEGECKN
jgi:hypothetical protein